MRSKPSENFNFILVCDSCHHSVAREQITKDDIGFPCPVCDEPMFTAGEWRAWRRFRFWERVGLFLHHLFPRQFPLEEITVLLRQNGTYSVRRVGR